jgi:hypothetical protein
MVLIHLPRLLKLRIFGLVFKTCNIQIYTALFSTKKSAFSPHISVPLDLNHKQHFMPKAVVFKRETYNFSVRYKYFTHN